MDLPDRHQAFCKVEVDLLQTVVAAARTTCVLVLAVHRELLQVPVPRPQNLVGRKMEMATARVTGVVAVVVVQGLQVRMQLLQVEQAVQAFRLRLRDRVLHTPAVVVAVVECIRPQHLEEAVVRAAVGQERRHQTRLVALHKTV